MTKKPELTVKAINAKEKKKKLEKKKKKKKTEEDEKFEKAYEDLKEYHEGYEVDVEKGGCCDEC